MAQRNNRFASIAAFTLFSAWLISFPYQGQLLYSLLSRHGLDTSAVVWGAIAAHIAGLLTCGFLAKSALLAKRLMLFSCAACIAGSALFFLPFPFLYVPALFAVSLIAGFFIAAWGYFFREAAPRGERIGVVAYTLAVSAIIMIGINLCAAYVSAYVALGISLLALLGALLLTWKLVVPVSDGDLKEPRENREVSFVQPLFALCAFILIITIDSGLMFQVVMPAFSNIGFLVDWYWAVPYIAAILIVKRLPAKLNKSYILYAAIAMLGFAFIAFMALDRSALSYLIINTLLLGACGINDLFWWTILGDLLDFHRNPAKILGIGLGTNVAGVLIGEFIGAFHTPTAPSGAAALTGMAVVCVALVLLPPLHRQLSLVLKGNSFLAALSTLPPQEQAKTVSDAVRIAELTERENEIAMLLLKGRPYKLIAEALFISESTVKTHVQSIYYKLNIHSRTELIQKISLNG